MHLEAIAKLPLWRLDLVNNSVILFDPGQLEVTDAATRESFSCRGWRLGVAQLAGGGSDEIQRRHCEFLAVWPRP